MRKSLLSVFVFFLFLCASFLNAAGVSCSRQYTAIEHRVIYSEFLYGNLVFDVYVPPCMDSRIDGGYPVLYLIHGQDMGNEIWQEMNTAEIMQETIDQEDLPLFLIVAPREDQYLLSFSLSGYGEAILNDLIPWIDGHYNTCTERECRGIGGLSRGALWAELLAFENPDIFGSLALLSMPGTILDDQRIYYLTEKHKPDHLLRIRMDIGGEDNYRHDGSKAASQLTFLGYPFEYNILPGNHDREYWQSRLSDLFIWFNEGWKGTVSRK